MNSVRNKFSDRSGMTMAELLVVVVIIVILAALAFISLVNHQRNLAQFERDKIAKELFYAAQNHLTTARGEGYLDLEKTMTDETKDDVVGEEDSSVSGAYYFVFPSSNTYSLAKDSILDLMLPFGSIDETVRAGGSYIIRYHKPTGRVMDVFYCSASGSPAKFNHTLTQSDFVAGIVPDYSGDDKMKARRHYVDDSVLGWYGGDGGDDWDNPKKLETPDIEVKNEEQLYVNVTDNNSGKYSLKLIITGENSGAQKSFVLFTDSAAGTEMPDSSGRVTHSGSTYKILLDDITTAGMHFAKIEAENGKSFTPGENLKIQAVAYSLNEFTSIEYSAEEKTNSLFADNGKGGVNNTVDTAYVKNIRHLENLDKAVSNLNANNGSSVNGDIVKISKGVQIDDMFWDGTTSGKAFIPRIKALKDSSDAPKIYKYSSESASTDAGYYLPTVLSGYSYDGSRYSITGIRAKSNADGNAGLFGSLTDSVAKNVKLIDFEIEATSNAGALAGTITGSNMEVSNVAVISSASENRANEKKVAVKANNAGGLIGSMSGGTVKFSSASVRVNGTAAAGGLIGTSTGTVTGCYSGGHTEDGSYDKWIKDNGYDITGSTVGGLIGTAGGTSISKSYSTCSVSGSNLTGGFVGSASGTIADCYATGAVETEAIKKKDDHTVNNKSGSFAGSFTGTVPEGKECHYFSSINEVSIEETQNGNKKYMMDHYLGSVGDDDNARIKPIDITARAYENFVGGNWQPADPYDSTLKKYYGGKYNLKTVKQLYGDDYPENADYFTKIHRGDWPSPEALLLNRK